jgi:hypothetical protein
MKLLECIKDDGYTILQLSQIVNFPVKGEIYSKRSSIAVGNGEIGYTLEEIRNPPMPNGIEPSFNKKRFREIKQDDINIKSLLKETELENIQSL